MQQLDVDAQQTSKSFRLNNRSCSNYSKKGSQLSAIKTKHLKHQRRMTTLTKQKDSVTKKLNTKLKVICKWHSVFTIGILLRTTTNQKKEVVSRICPNHAIFLN